MNVVFVTSNAHKAKYFSELIGHDIQHESVDMPEIQSLDVDEVVTAKAKAAYELIKQPVIVEDTSLVIRAMGRLPGTFIKWFLDELGPEGLCSLADADPARSAIASATFAYYDGNHLRLFTGSLAGTIAKMPLGESGFGWNRVFIPEGSTLTLGQMDEAAFKKEYMKIKHFAAVKEFIDNLKP